MVARFVPVPPIPSVFTSLWFIFVVAFLLCFLLLHRHLLKRQFIPLLVYTTGTIDLSLIGGIRPIFLEAEPIFSNGSARIALLLL